MDFPSDYNAKGGGLWLIRILISLSGGKMLVAHLAWRQCPPHHVHVLLPAAIKFNFSAAKRKIWNEVLVLYSGLRKTGI